MAFQKRKLKEARKRKKKHSIKRDSVSLWHLLTCVRKCHPQESLDLTCVWNHSALLLILASLVVNVSPGEYASVSSLQMGRANSQEHHEDWHEPVLGNIVPNFHKGHAHTLTKRICHYCFLCGPSRPRGHETGVYESECLRGRGSAGTGSRLMILAFK